MVWASPISTPLHEEAIAQARINHYKGSAQLLVRAESSREDRGQGGEFYSAAGFADRLAAQANNPYWLHLDPK
jgi:hypothetical protein